MRFLVPSSSSRKTARLGAVPDGSDPQALRHFLSRVKVMLETIVGDRGLSESRPTVQQLIDAEVTNAEDIE